MMSDIAISVNSISKQYSLYDSPQHRLYEALSPTRRKFHHNFHALQNVSFVVRKGESVGIIGRNGSGKSTLLKIISGVLTPTSGNVEVNGTISSLLELGAGFNPELTGIENVFFNGTLMGYSREEMNNKLDHILAFADIGDFVNQPVKTYSSGMFVRLAFAVAVCVEPEILIVDEALSVGDMAFQQKCLDRLRILKEKGVTILLVTHDIMLTRNYCEYVVYLQNGKVALIADAETAGELYVKDMRSEIQELVDTTKKTEGGSEQVSFGNSEGEITAVEVINPESDLPIFAGNDLLVIRVSARAKKHILFPRIIVQIRDFRGYILYGIHTTQDELQKIEKNEFNDFCASLSFRVTLSPGNYSITIAINNVFDEMTQVVLEKQVGVADFTVLPKSGDRDFHGVINLNAVWDKSAEIKHQGTLCMTERIASDIDSMNLVIGCVAENTPKYLAQALRLLQSIRWFGGKIATSKFIVCAVEEIDPAYKEEFKKYSADVRIVERFSEKHPQSNKLRFLQQPDLKNYSNILLLDCDTIIVQDPSAHFQCEGLRAKLADGPTVSSLIFKKLFDFFKLEMPMADYNCTVRGTPTIPYFNAGVLLFSQLALTDLVPVWVKYNEQLIKHLDLLGDSANFCEQASLSLALAEIGLKFDVFGDDINFPIHHDDYINALENTDPLLIHYHSLVTPSGYIMNSKYPLANKRITQFNDRLRVERENNFDNKLFWNNRYKENPELGSGVGSRGVHREYKRNLLKSVIDSDCFNTILDIGCGDMEVSSVLPVSGYIGIDVSSIVIDKNREFYPERTFICGNFLELDLSSADLVVCMDVLIHVNDKVSYNKFVARLVEKTIKVGVVAGYEVDPGCSGIIFFHEPLSETLKRMGAKDINKIGSYRDTDIFVFTKE